jgi:hypothetical protein
MRGKSATSYYPNWWIYYRYDHLGIQLYSLQTNNLFQVLHCVNWGSVAVSFGAGAVAGLVGFGVFRVTTAILGTGFWATVGADALSGVLAGHYARFIGSILSGDISQAPVSSIRNIVVDAIISGVIAGVFYGLSSLIEYVKFQSEISNPYSQLPIRAGNGDKTSAIFVSGQTKINLESGWNGPTYKIPPKTPGFNIVTLTHVEGHASAFMRQNALTSGTLYINNMPCPTCTNLLPRMLPPDASLRIIGPNGYDVIFKGLLR